MNTSVQAPETTTEVKTNTSEKELEESTSTETVNEQVTPETQKTILPVVRKKLLLHIKIQLIK